MPDYVLTVTTKAPAADAKPLVIERLVRAKNQASAVGHVVSDTVTCKLAETDEIIRLAKAGVERETAE